MSLLTLVFLLATRHAIPATVLWLPALWIPQFLLTAGLCYLFAAIGTYAKRPDGTFHDHV